MIGLVSVCFFFVCFFLFSYLFLTVFCQVKGKRNTVQIFADKRFSPSLVSFHSCSKAKEVYYDDINCKKHREK